MGRLRRADRRATGSGSSPSSARQADDADRTLLLAVLRGCLLDLLATGDVDRTSAAVQRYLRLVGPTSGAVTHGRGAPRANRKRADPVGPLP